MHSKIYNYLLFLDKKLNFIMIMYCFLLIFVNFGLDFIFGELSYFCFFLALPWKMLITLSGFSITPSVVN